MASDRRTDGISASHAEEIIEAVSRELREHPPAIGIVGVSGVGKSSTINQLFRTELPTSDTVACTKEFRSVALSVEYTGKQPVPSAISLRVIDAPGLGEDRRKDAEYLGLYKENLPQCDVILWMISARNRAIALDQGYLNELVEFHDKIVLRISQIDIVEPIDWSDRYNVPSSTQAKNIKIIQRDRRDRISRALGREVQTVAFSSRRGYQLNSLFRTLLSSCPFERQWIYEGLKNFDHRQFAATEIKGSGAGRAASLIARLLSRPNQF